MKQKIVIKLQPDCDKCRSKAMTLAAQPGVDSVRMEGKNRDELVVIGEGVDPTKLIRALRRKLGRADILEVNVLKKEEKNKYLHIGYNVPYQYAYPRPVSESAIYSSSSTCSNHNGCPIM